MSAVQSAFEPVLHAPAPDHTRTQAPFGAIVARQLSMWPFAARTASMFLLVDPSLPDQGLRRGLLRAMQQAYFASDGHSQTRAVREAALAAHYVLQHHNRDVLPLNQVIAASAVAALRGRLAFVALAGHAAAFAWRDGKLTGKRGILRLPRPLGLEQDPVITLWSTSIEPGDRLLLVCGATWRPNSDQAIEDILSTAASAEAAEQQLAEALGDVRPACVLVVSPGVASRRTPHMRLVASNERSDATAEPTPAASAPRRHFAFQRWLFTLLGASLFALVALAALTIVPRAAPLTDRIDYLRPVMAVRLGPSAGNVVDLAVGDSAIYTLDVVEGAVRAFALGAFEQQPTPETLVAQTGMPLEAGRRLAPPVAIEYLPSLDETPGNLAIIDQSRAVVQVGEDRRLSQRFLPSSASWRELGALGTNLAGGFFFLDSGAHQLLQYPGLGEPVIDPPQVILDAARAPRLAFERVAQVIGEGESVVLRMDDGSVQELDPRGVDRRVTAQTSDTPVQLITAMAGDRNGALYFADAAAARVVETTLDGQVVRQLRDPALAGVRAMGLSLDGRRLYALVASGILVFDIPAL